MRRTCFEMLVQLGHEIGLVQDVSITSFSDTLLRKQILWYLNRAKEWVIASASNDLLMATTSIASIAQYTTGTAAITNGRTSVVGTGTTFTSAMVGRKIKIGSDTTPYEIKEYTDSTHIEIDRPFIGTTETAGAIKIFQDVLTLPPFVESIIDIRRMDSRRVLNRRTISWIDTRYPDPLQGTGEPYNWALVGVLETRDPTGTTNFTADASTSSTSIVDSGLTNTTVQDYYKDWYVYNNTQSASSRVTAYDISTTTLSLETPITSQASGDTFYLKKRELQIKLRGTPLTAIPLIVTYKKKATFLVNDTDYENEIDANNESILIYRAAEEYYRPRDSKKVVEYERLSRERLQNIKEANNNFAVGELVFGDRRFEGDDVWADSYSRRGY